VGTPQPFIIVQEGSREKVDVMPGVSNTRLRTAVGITRFVSAAQKVDCMGKTLYSELDTKETGKLW